QRAVVDLVRSDEDISVEALAGTGKTTTLTLASQAMRGRGQYIAFNKAIVADSKGKFPNTVNCSTAHGLAYRAIGHRYSHRLPSGGGTAPQRLTNPRLAQLWGIKAFQALPSGGPRQLDAAPTARLAQATVRRFCQMPEPEIRPDHVPAVPLFGHGTAARAALTATVIPLALRIWNDLQSPVGTLPFDHAHYLKLWQLSAPTINADYILFD